VCFVDLLSSLVNIQTAIPEFTESTKKAQQGSGLTTSNNNKPYHYIFQALDTNCVAQVAIGLQLELIVPIIL